MPFSSLRFGQFCDFCPKVSSFLCFVTFVQRFVFPHLDPKGLKSCHFHLPH
ncbi:hypothetical protein HanXRQr2_Chr10g0454691 [Helianthus annuus]|uniref:Uncharacterized protein n=1 Tax=Helianthus annuus TaxID=4232 RepID=A0A9K3I015_HELAN|nr:hypothetical protein HanXRQr2_Chr10g0454691 [Helianthus annuus]